jgi:hypothetical protein
VKGQAAEWEKVTAAGAAHQFFALVAAGDEFGFASLDATRADKVRLHGR